MGLWHKLLYGGTSIEQRAAPSGLATPQVWLADALAGAAAPSGKRVSVQSAMGLAPVWAAVSIIAEQIGQLPLKVYKNVDGEDVEAQGSRGWRLLHDKPNSHTPAGRFWSTVAAHLLLWGNAFIVKRRDSLGLVDELHLLKPAEVTVFYNPGTGEKLFRHQPTDGSKPRDYSADDLLHIFGLSLDGIVGESVIAHCKASLGAALARDEYEGTFYARGTNLAGVLQHPQKLSKDAAVNLKESFDALYGRGSATAHGVPVLEEGMTFVPISSPMKDLEFVAAQQLSRTDIAVMFKLPPNTLGGSSGDSLTYSTVELNQQHIAIHAISPVTTTISQALTYDPAILPQTIFSCAFLLDAMMRADSKTRAEVYALGLDPAKGWLNREEVRRRENLYPADDSPAVEDVVAPQVPPGLPDVTPQPALNGSGAVPR